jgi:PQQ-like domain
MVGKGWLALASSMLCACGGGGGGGGGGGEDNSWLTFTPSPVTVTAYAGDSPNFSVTARSTKTISEPLNMAIVDRVGVITTSVSIVPVSQTEYRATLQLSPNLGTGTHTGNLEVRLCRDNPVSCQSPYPGSPWQVPYRFAVQSGTNLSALQPLAGAGAWSTYQGSASHTGYVPASVNPTNFSRRFALPNVGSSVVVEDGRVFTATGTRGGSSPWSLRAISESTGQVLWATPMGALFQVNPPAVSNGKVYAASTGHSDTHFWTFDATTGTQLARTAMSSQWETYLAPTVHGGKVYTNSGSFGGLSRFDAATSAFNWFVSLSQYDDWTPAVDDSYVYVHVGSQFRALRPSDGTTALTITDPRYEWSGYSMHGAPVLDGQGGAFATQYGSLGSNGLQRGRLIKFNITGSTLAWDLAQNFDSNPVLANGVLYIVNGAAFEARSPASGALLWSWTAPEGFSTAVDTPSPVVVVGNHAFVGTASATRAIDLTTHQSVWSYPGRGPMAVSANGVLYINTPSSLVAINLQ